MVSLDLVKLLIIVQKNRTFKGCRMLSASAIGYILFQQVLFVVIHVRCYYFLLLKKTP